MNYKGRILKWDTTIEQKTNELGRFLVGRSTELDFAEPATMLERTDNRAIREMILNLTQSHARKRGIGKSTFHYLSKKARGAKSFTVYKPLEEKLLEY